MKRTAKSLTIAIALGGLLLGAGVLDGAPEASAQTTRRTITRRTIVRRVPVRRYRTTNRVYRNGRMVRSRTLGWRNDLDRDGIRNSMDKDRDGDGVRNVHDRRPDNRFAR